MNEKLVLAIDILSELSKAYNESELAVRLITSLSKRLRGQENFEYDCTPEIMECLEEWSSLEDKRQGNICLIEKAKKENQECSVKQVELIKRLKNFY